MQKLYELFLENPTITTDSRICPSKSIFFALKGEKADGNQFAEKAVDNGCAYAVVDDARYKTRENIILVDDVLQTLQQLAKYHRMSLGLPVIGVTGTNGKTTTKELLATVLQQKYKVGFTQGNFNNHIGVPLTLLSLNESHELAIVEMGANHPKEIAALTEIAVPNAGLVTNVGKAHIEGFGSFEGVIRTKSEMYDFLRTIKGLAFVNLDNEILMSRSGELERVGYGMKRKDGIAWGEVVSSSPFLRMNVQTVDDEKIYSVDTKLIGAYNAENVLAAVAVGRYFGIEMSKIVSAIENYEPKNNRSQFVKTDRNHLLIDAYNANPTSMRAAIENFAYFEAENKALILGDMRELGQESEIEHHAILDLLNKYGFEEVYLVGPCFGMAKTKFPKFENVESLCDYVQKSKLEGKTILIKGSNGIHLNKIIEWL